jgi:hypothetical protein
MIKKITTITLVLFFIGAMFGGLFHISTGTDMSEDMMGCPFVSGQEAVCTMVVTDHISAWQATFMAVIPAFSLFMLGAVGAVIVYSSAAHLFIKLSSGLLLLFRYCINKVYTFPRRPLQELFSNGILHPKLF